MIGAPEGKPHPPEGKPDPRLIVLSLAAIGVLSIPAFFRRFLNDMDSYAHVADKLLNGGILYKDAIDTKPPLIFIHYALVFRLFGENNVAAVKIVTIIFLVLSALTIALVQKELFPRAKRPELAALLFVLASFSGWGEDFLSSNTEILANLFILAGVYWMVKDDFRYDPGRLLLGGALTGVAFLYRFQSGAPLVAYFLLLVFLRGAFQKILPRLACLGAGFLTPIAAWVSYYTITTGTAGWRYLQAFLLYDYVYLRGGGIYWPAALAQAAVAVSGQLHFLLLAVWQALVILRDEDLSKSNAFLLLFFGFSFSAFFVGGRFFAHYIVQTIPALALLATQRLSVLDPVGHTGWLARAGSIYRRNVLALIVLHAALFGVANGVYYWKTRERLDAYPNLVRFARAHTTKRDPVFVWTSNTQVLFDMDRVYATRFFSNDFLVGRMYGTRHRRASATAESAREASVRELWPLLLQDLEAMPPRLIVDDIKERSNFTLDRYAELRSFVERNYEPCRVMDEFCVYLRKGGS